MATEEPKTESRGFGESITHPCFGLIGASRVSGSAILHGSEFVHNNYVTISIHTSSLNRKITHDFDYAEKELIQIAVSEAQWATFVSSLNVGMGVPCTIQRREGQVVPGLPFPRSQETEFHKDTETALKEAVQYLDKIKELIDGNDMKLNKRQRELLSAPLHLAHMRLTSSLGFISEQFVKHTKKYMEKAKSEVSAWAQNLLMRAGLSALGNRDVPLQLSSKEEEN